MKRQLEITFKSGATVSVDVETFKLTKNVMGNRSIEWTTPDRKAVRRLVSFELDETVAIVEVTQ